MGNPTLNKNYIAEAAVTAHRIVQFGATDGAVLHAAAAADKSIGVSMELDTALGGRVDVVRTGMPDVEYGGTVAAGDLLTSDSVGRAVVANPGAGANVRIVGTAEVAAVSGDIAPMTLSLGMMQG